VSVCRHVCHACFAGLLGKVISLPTGVGISCPLRHNVGNTMHQHFGHLTNPGELTRRLRHKKQNAMSCAPALKYETNDTFETTPHRRQRLANGKPKPPPGCILLTDSQALVSSSDTFHNSGEYSCRSTSSEECDFMFGGESAAFAMYSSPTSTCAAYHNAALTHESESAISLVSSFLGLIEEDIAHLRCTEDGWYGGSCDELYTASMYRKSGSYRNFGSEWGDVTTTESAASCIPHREPAPVVMTCPEAGCFEESLQRAVTLNKSADFASRRHTRCRTSSAVRRRRQTVDPGHSLSVSGATGGSVTIVSRGRNIESMAKCKICTLDGVKLRPSCPLVHQSCEELLVLS
jgi:hypothetical protein